VVNVQVISDSLPPNLATLNTDISMMRIWFAAAALIAFTISSTDVKADDLLKQTIPATSESSGYLMAVGDIADCSWRNPQVAEISDLSTEELAEHNLSGNESLPRNSLALEELMKSRRGIILALGDLAYPKGTRSDFTDCFDKIWGPLVERTYPVPGNHEYKSKAKPYLDYWKERRGLEKTYYSFDYAGWHVIALDSELEASPGSVQRQWLDDDLARSKKQCVIAMFHKPAIATVLHGKPGSSEEIYDTVSRAGASIVLNGHNHNYERSKLLDANRQPTQFKGTRTFIVGTGGEVEAGESQSPGTLIEKSISGKNGFLELRLNKESYDWKFIAVPDAAILDSGHADCTTTQKLN
jgi:acid phosphatase type 7